MNSLIAGIDLATERMRAGRRVFRTLYVHTADNIDGRLIGMVDTPELAALICEAVNAYLDALPKAEPLLDPDCRDGKCGSCIGGPCEHGCHSHSTHPNLFAVLHPLLAAHRDSGMTDNEFTQKVVDAIREAESEAAGGPR